MARVGVLMPRGRGVAPDPSALPLGRAALHLATVGVEVVFVSSTMGGRVSGQRAVLGGWTTVEAAAVAGVFDRYPSQTDPHGHSALLSGLDDVPVANPVSQIDLMRDKVLTQQILTAAGLSMPEVVTEPAQFGAALERWGAGYLKPRYGAFGRGVVRVVPGDPLSANGPGAVPGVPEPLFLQRAVAPLAPYAGVSARILVQRAPDGWWVGPPVARCSLTDPVVNAARGAEVRPVEQLTPGAAGRLPALAQRAAEALAQREGGELLVELGVDAVIDQRGRAHLIEVNSRPRGRLQAVAEADPARFRGAHIGALCRPLLWLAGR